MILLVDNYDSFSYNLYQLLGAIHPEIRVIRNDQETPEQILREEPEAVILSPGPGRPEQAGYCMEIVKTLGKRIPILGVCLGHQAICAAYGARITYAEKLMHGKQSRAELDTGSWVFRGLPKPLPFTGGGGGNPASGAAGDSPLRGRRSDGGTAQKFSCVRTAVPSGIDYDAGWGADYKKFSGGGII